MKLTPKQSEAIRQSIVNMRLIAYAGSSKTEVVARRVVKLLDPKSAGELLSTNIIIIAFTFTDKAADELKDRIVTRCREQLGNIVDMAGLYVGTIHSAEYGLC